MHVLKHLTKTHGVPLMDYLRVLAIPGIILILTPIPRLFSTTNLIQFTGCPWIYSLIHCILLFNTNYLYVV